MRRRHTPATRWCVQRLAESSISTSWIGSARTEFNELSAAEVSASRIRSGPPEAIKLCGVCSPNTVIVCAPEARNSSDRIDGSFRE